MKQLLFVFLLASSALLASANNGTPGSAPAQPQNSTQASQAPVAAIATGPARDLTIAKLPTSAPAVTVPVATPIVAKAAAPAKTIAARPGFFKRIGMKFTKTAHKVGAFFKKMANQTTSILIGVLIALAIILAFAIDSTFGLVVLLVGVIIALFMILR